MNYGLLVAAFVSEQVSWVHFKLKSYSYYNQRDWGKPVARMDRDIPSISLPTLGLNSTHTIWLCEHQLMIRGTFSTTTWLLHQHAYQSLYICSICITWWSTNDLLRWTSYTEINMQNLISNVWITSFSSMSVLLKSHFDIYIYIYIKIVSFSYGILSKTGYCLMHLIC